MNINSLCAEENIKNFGKSIISSKGRLRFIPNAFRDKKEINNRGYKNFV